MSGSFSSGLLDSLAHPAQVNYLDVVNKSAYAANLINEARKTQAQQLAGQAAQDAITNGVFDPVAARANLANAGPNAALAVPESLKATSQLSTDQLAQASAHNGLISQYSAPLIRNPSDANVNAMFDTALNDGLPASQVEATRQRFLAMPPADRQQLAYHLGVGALTALDRMHRQAGGTTLQTDPNQNTVPVTTLPAAPGQPASVTQGVGGAKLGVSPDTTFTAGQQPIKQTIPVDADGRPIPMVNGQPLTPPDHYQEVTQPAHAVPGWIPGQPGGPGGQPGGPSAFPNGGRNVPVQGLPGASVPPALLKTPPAAGGGPPAAPAVAPAPGGPQRETFVPGPNGVPQKTLVPTQGTPASAPGGGVPQPGAPAAPATPVPPQAQPRFPAVPMVLNAPPQGQSEVSQANRERYVAAANAFPQQQTAAQNIQHAQDALKIITTGNTTERQSSIRNALSAMGMLPPGPENAEANYEVFRKYTERAIVDAANSAGGSDLAKAQATASNAGTSLINPANAIVMRNDLGKILQKMAMFQDSPDKKAGQGQIVHETGYLTKTDYRGFNWSQYSPEEQAKIQQEVKKQGPAADAALHRAIGISTRLGLDPGLAAPSAPAAPGKQSMVTPTALPTNYLAMATPPGAANALAAA